MRHQTCIHYLFNCSRTKAIFLLQCWQIAFHFGILENLDIWKIRLLSHSVSRVIQRSLFCFRVKTCFIAFITKFFIRFGFHKFQSLLFLLPLSTSSALTRSLTNMIQFINIRQHKFIYDLKSCERKISTEKV